MGVWTQAPRLLTSSFARFSRQLTTAKYDKLSVGVPKEAWPHERRVAITPDKVAQLKKAGVAEVRVESGAGAEASFTDQAYAAAGALIVKRQEAFAADVVFKVRKLRETCSAACQRSCHSGQRGTVRSHQAPASLQVRAPLPDERKYLKENGWCEALPAAASRNKPQRYWSDTL